MIKKTIFIRILSYLIFAFIVIFALVQSLYNPAAIKALNELKGELALINMLTGDVPKGMNENHKAATAGVTAFYLTGQINDTICKYYDGQFQRNGWKYSDSSNYKEWGKDLGEKSLNYQKGEYKLRFHYGKLSDDGTQIYSISLSWN